MNEETPYKALLDREGPIKIVEKSFPELISSMRDMVNFGTNLIVRCFAVSSERKMKDIIILGVLLKQIVSMFDALEILISNASIRPAFLQLRAMFEASLYIEWILKEDSEAKAAYYYVSNLRKEKEFYLKMRSGSDENLRYKEKMAQFESEIDGFSDNHEKNIKTSLAKVETILNREEYLSINQAFNNFKNGIKIKKRRKIKYEPDWYKPLGVNSIRDLACKLGRLSYYEFIYTRSSAVMHSAEYDDHIEFKKGEIHFITIRHLENIGEVARYSIPILLGTYLKVIQQYRPGELSAYKKKYVENWREPYLNIPNIDYTKVTDEAI